jgi:hypothetical protein
VKALRSQYLAVGLILLTLLTFAAQGGAMGSPPREVRELLLPLAVLSVATGIVLTAQAFPGRPVVSAAISGLAVAAFLYGEAFCNTALDMMFSEPMPWWREDVMGSLLVFTGPATLVATIGAFILSRHFGRGAS